MNNNNLVTIVTVTHNLIEAGRKESFIKCIESVHGQTYKNIEHIVIDGASTDGTLDLIKECYDKGHITSYITEEDAGIYDAFNKGILASNGKYIAFLNSDDYYHDMSGVEETMKYLKETNADFSYATCKIINEAGEETNLYNANVHCAFTKTPFMHITMFTKKEVLLKENLFDTTYKIAADYDLILKLLLKRRKCVKVPKIFATFRSGGISGNDKLAAEDCANLYYKTYSPFCKITAEECKKLWSMDIIPIPLLLSLMRKCGFDFAVGMLNFYSCALFTHYLPIFRKWLIQIRTKKGQETLKLFGIYFIKPKNGEI